MSVSALKEYFEPLRLWLLNNTSAEKHGWTDDCSHMKLEDEVKEWLDEYELLAQEAYSRSAEADWKYATDIRQETQWERVEIFSQLFIIFILVIILLKNQKAAMDLAFYPKKPSEYDPKMQQITIDRLTNNTNMGTLLECTL